MNKIRYLAVVALTAACLVNFASAQIPANHAVVVTRHTSQPLSRMLMINLATGKTAPLGRFKSDNLPPLAVRIDPVNDDLVVALQTSTGSRIVRMTPAIGAMRETQLATVTSLVQELAFDETSGFFFGGRSDILFTAGGSLWRMRRNRGQPTRVFSAARISAFFVSGDGTGVIAQNGVVNQAIDPLLHNFSFRSHSITRGTYLTRNHRPVGFPGVAVVPAGILNKVIVAQSNGTLATSVFGSLSTYNTTPKLPAGATHRLRIQPTPPSPFVRWRPVVLGNKAAPRLRTVNLNQAAKSLPWVNLSAALPGDPVDFDVTAVDPARFRVFDERCLGSQQRISVSNIPRLRSDLRISSGLLKSSGVAALLVGLSDQIEGGTRLPMTLPGGCSVAVSRDTILFAPIIRNGAQLRATVPNDQTLVGINLFLQWAEFTGGRFETSQALALHIH